MQNQETPAVVMVAIQGQQLCESAFHAFVSAAETVHARICSTSLPFVHLPNRPRKTH